jgi:hypothetical protein
MKVKELSRFCRSGLRGSCQPVKEPLNVSDAGIKVSNVASKVPLQFSHAASKVPLEISHATGKVIQLRLHPIEAGFDRCQSLLCRRGFIYIILRSQAAYEMMLLCVLPRTSHQVGDALRIASVAYVEVI